MIRSLLPRVNSTLEPPSPESRENPPESGPPPPDSSSTKPRSSSGPPMIPSVEMPDPKPTSDNPASSARNRRTIGEWFRKATTKRSHNRTPRQTRSKVPHQSGIPSQTKVIPPKEKPSTMAPGKRQAVSVPSSVNTGNGYLTARLSGRFIVVDQRLVHASYPFMNVVPHHTLQKKAAPKPVASSQPPKTTPQPEAGSSNVANETKAEISGGQHNREARVYFTRFAARAHNNYCSEKLGGHRRTRLIFPSQCRYPLGFVVAV